jgi:methanogenic corrinoid protein MtbC1
MRIYFCLGTHAAFAVVDWFQPEKYMRRSSIQNDKLQVIVCRSADGQLHTIGHRTVSEVTCRMRFTNLV